MESRRTKPGRRSLALAVQPTAVAVHRGSNWPRVPTDRGHAGCAFILSQAKTIPCVRPIWLSTDSRLPVLPMPLSHHDCPRSTGETPDELREERS